MWYAIIEEVLVLRAERFLQLYRVLEDALGEKYSGRTMRHASVVMEYLSDPESEPIREKLDLMREMRNVLSHNADIDGQMVFEPSEGVLKAMEEIVEYVKRPPLAIHCATPVDRLFCAGYKELALNIMRAMEKRGFSHVPILEKGRLVGVFSVRTVFSKMVRDPDFDIRSDTTLEDFRMLLPIEAHRGEKYGFMAADTSLYEARQVFTAFPAPNRRLAALFLTEHGDEDEPILGMLTPWDVMGESREDH